MRILIVSAKDDNGGIGIAIKRAFDKYAPEHEVRSVTRHSNFIRWDADIVLDESNKAEVQELFDKADVIHVMDIFAAVEQFERYEDKPKVFHHHGLDFRQDHAALYARCEREGIQQLVATHDLLRYGDNLTWLPNPCDIDSMQFFRKQEYRPTNFVRVVQTPTSLQANGTARFLDAVDKLPANTLDKMQLDIVQNLPWVDCMRRKAKADIVFDSFGVGYGLTTIEAMGMGIPVIHSADEQATEATRRTIGYLPYLHPDPKYLSSVLEAIVESPEIREQVAAAGWQAVNDFHAEHETVRRLLDVYERALA